MKIEIPEIRDRNFYKEVVNITHQFRSLLKKPDKKQHDFYKDFTLYIIIGFVLIALVVLMTISWGFDWMMAVALCLSLILILFGILYRVNLEKIVKALVADAGPSVVTIDDTGVELFKENSKTVRIAWEKVYFVRQFKYSICFIPKDYTSFIVAVNNDYADEIKSYLRENRPKLTIIE